MKYFMDTHDRTKGSFPAEELTEGQFFAQFDALEKAAHELDVFGHAAHVNLHEGKAFCFMSGPDEDAIRKPAAMYREMDMTAWFDQAEAEIRKMA